MRNCLFILLICLSGHLAAQYSFTTEVIGECTEVKDQQRSGTCWSFSTASLLESEILRNQGGATDLSEMYAVRMTYLEKARNYLMRQGQANFGEGGLNHDYIHAWQTYGAVPESIYPGRRAEDGALDHAELVAVLKSVLDGMLSHQVVSERWPEVVNAILDVYLGPVPQEFEINGLHYTPETYGQSLGLNPSDYVSLTSFTHHPFYQQFILEIPDNFWNGSYYNLPLDELVTVAEAVLSAGYTIAWDGDVSEPTFNQNLGLAVLPEHGDKEAFRHPVRQQEAGQQQRQRAFERLATTDDHLMHLVGIAYDQHGTKYFIVKNSWGPEGPYSGYLYMSEAYFRVKTIAILVNKSAIPSALSEKLQI